VTVAREIAGSGAGGGDGTVFDVDG